MPPKPPTIKSSTPRIRGPTVPSGSFSSSSTATSSARGRPLPPATGSARGLSPRIGGGAFRAQPTSVLAPGEIRPGVPSIRHLTAAQRLVVLERLERGVVGWDNLLRDVDGDASGEATGFGVAENLQSKFAALEFEESDEKGERGQEPNGDDLEEKENDTSLVGKMKRVLKIYDDLNSFYDKVLQAEADRMLAERYDCSQFVRLMEKVKEATRVMEDVLSVQRFSEVTNLVMEPKKKQKGTLPVPFEQQEIFVQQMETLSERIKKMDLYLSKGGAGALDLEGLILAYERQVEKLKANVKDTVELQQDIEFYKDFHKERMEMERDENGTLKDSSSVNSNTTLM